MHRRVTHNQHYPTEAEFIKKIHDFFAITLPQNWRDIRDVVSDNFHVIRPEVFRVLT